jgi:hypothetical protein
LDESLENALDDDPGYCVLSKQGRKIFTLPEQTLEIWKPLENWRDSLMDMIESNRSSCLPEQSERV